MSVKCIVKIRTALCENSKCKNPLKSQKKFGPAKLLLFFLVV